MQALRRFAGSPLRACVGYFGTASSTRIRCDKPPSIIVVLFVRTSEFWVTVKPHAVSRGA